MEKRKIAVLLRSFKKSSFFKNDIPRRLERLRFNSSWINPKAIAVMSEQDVKDHFKEYHEGGEGRQGKIQGKIDPNIGSLLKNRLPSFLAGSESLAQRFDKFASLSGEYHIPGINRAVATAMLMDYDFYKYCLWNSKTEEALQKLGIIQSSPVNTGEGYEGILKHLRELCDLVPSLELSFCDIDAFFQWITGEDEGQEIFTRISTSKVNGGALLNFPLYDVASAVKLLERN